MSDPLPSINIDQLTLAVNALLNNTQAFLQNDSQFNGTPSPSIVTNTAHNSGPVSSATGSSNSAMTFSNVSIPIPLMLSVNKGIKKGIPVSITAVPLSVVSPPPPEKVILQSSHLRPIAPAPASNTNDRATPVIDLQLLQALVSQSLLSSGGNEQIGNTVPCCNSVNTDQFSASICSAQKTNHGQPLAAGLLNTHLWTLTSTNNSVINGQGQSGVITQTGQTSGQSANLFTTNGSFISGHISGMVNRASVPGSLQSGRDTNTGSSVQDVSLSSLTSLAGCSESEVITTSQPGCLTMQGPLSPLLSTPEVFSSTSNIHTPMEVLQDVTGRENLSPTPCLQLHVSQAEIQGSQSVNQNLAVQSSSDVQVTVTKSKAVYAREIELPSKGIALHPPVVTDQSTFCIECNMLLSERCLLHNTNFTHLDDSPLLSRARASLPSCLYLRQSCRSQFPNYLGVWAKQTICARTRFGPLRGLHKPFPLPPHEEKNGDLGFCSWKVFDENGKAEMIDVNNEDNCNWMMFLRLASSLVDQNIIAYQQNSDIFVITSKEIDPDQELLVWYSTNYAKNMGVSQDPSVQKILQCQFCGKLFSGKMKLKEHIRKQHPDEHRQGWNCVICCKGLSSSSKLKNHMLSHMGIKPHACNTCGKQFSDPSNLRTHLSIHTGQRKFQCQMCPKTFRQKAHLDSHLLTHSGQKEYPCLHCDKWFARPSDRKTHMYIHTKEVVYNCDLCGKIFYKSQNLKKHMLVHSGDRKFICNLCDKRFGTKYHRDRHWKKCKYRMEVDESVTSDDVFQSNNCIGSSDN
ncbi:hypothetical protein CHS0354_032324 [Potamilus streckersoni]|uniref:PR domain zinc finger protein 4 n=1 Tax=Potamilus streckersoni TaxID=2493646 RepID=A0AAE0RQ59_9BIVA|nr:hypothetical protein CHS0354_032324 [Potamilus streckersoni]